MEFTYDEDTYSDLYKDAYGFRPRGGQYKVWAEMTPEQKQAEWDSLCETLRRRMADEALEQAVCKSSFIEAIRAYKAAGITDPASIMAAMHDVNKTEGDNEYLEYHYGLPYGWLKSSEFQAVI